MAEPNQTSQQPDPQRDQQYQQWLAQQRAQPGQTSAPGIPGAPGVARKETATVPADTTPVQELWPDASEMVALLVRAREYLVQHSVHNMASEIDAELNGAWAERAVGATDGENTDFSFSTQLTEATEIVIDGESQEFEILSDGRTARLANPPEKDARIVGRRMRKEVAVGAADGANRDFTLSNPVLSETEIYVDGKPYPYDLVNAKTVRLVRPPPIGAKVEASRIKTGKGSAQTAPKSTTPPTEAATRVPPMEQSAKATQPPSTPP